MPRGVPRDPAGKKQSEKQQRFALIFTDPGVKGRNAITAYVEAGYASLSRTGKPDPTLRVRAYGVLHTPSMQREIKRILAEREAKADSRDNLTVDQVRHEHWKLYDLALRRARGEDGEYVEASASALSVANQILIALGKTVAAYVDRTELDVGKQREYSEAERLEALAIAKLRLEHRPALVLEHPVVPAVVEQETYEEQTETGPVKVIEVRIPAPPPMPESIKLVMDDDQEEREQQAQGQQDYDTDASPRIEPAQAVPGPGTYTRA